MIETTLDECFKKTKPQKSNSSFKGQVHNSLGLLCRNLTKFAARGKVQRKVAEQYRDLILKLNTEKVAEVNNQKLLKRVESLAEDDHFSAQKFWKAKKSIEGSQQNCHSVLDENGIEVYEPESLINTYRKEFDSRLSSFPIKPHMEDFKQRTDRLCREIIKATKGAKEDDFTPKEIDYVVKKLKNGKAAGLDRKPAEVYMHGGPEFLEAVLHVLNTIKRDQITPQQWQWMLISCLYKGKGSRKELTNQRGIFLTQVISKIWERLIKTRTKDATARINKLQAGCAVNKSTSDQTFLLRSCIHPCPLPQLTLISQFL